MYLFHFSRPVRRRNGLVQHYLGCTNELGKRLQEHRRGSCRYTRGLAQEGVDLVVAATWEGGWEVERQLEALGSYWHLCPICKDRRFRVLVVVPSTARLANLKNTAAQVAQRYCSFTTQELLKSGPLGKGWEVVGGETKLPFFEEIGREGLA